MLYAQPQTTIPGPKGLPIRGNLVDFRTDPLSLLERTARDFGDIAKVRMGPRAFYLVSHPDYIEAILLSEQRNFQKVQLGRTPKALGNGLLRSEGEFHLRQRRLVQPAFHRQRIASYAEVMTRYSEKMLADWQNKPICDAHAEMNRLTLLIVAQTLFNSDLSDKTNDISQALTDALLWLNQRMSQPLANLLPENWPTPANRRFQKATATLDQIIYTMIAERRQSGEDKGDLLSMLLLAQDEEGGTGAMDDKQLRDEVLTLLLAGHETTANALSWVWYLLATHPAVREKLEVELEEVLSGRTPTFNDLPRLQYTGMIIDEALRLYPPAWTQARQLVGDWSYGPYHIPAGSIILLSQYVMHRHPHYWEAPDQFQPERFDPILKSNRPRFAYFPFGAGMRQCVGQQFALMEAKLILATVAQNYHLDLLPNQTITAQPLITLRPKQGLMMQLSRRPA